MIWLNKASEYDYNDEHKKEFPPRVNVNVRAKI